MNNSSGSDASDRREPGASPRNEDPGASPPRGSCTIALIIAWSIVSIPALWGISQTVKTSINLFRAPPPAAQSAQSGTAHP